MRRALACAALGLAAACSLTTQPDDYFYEDGRIVQIARFDEGAPTNLVVAADALYASVGRAIVRIPKGGGAPTTLVRLASPPRGLDAHRAGQLLVCDPDRGAFFVATAPPYGETPIAIPGAASGCLAAATSDVLAVVVPETEATDGGPTPRPRVAFAPAGGAVTVREVAASLATVEDALLPAVAVRGTDVGFVVKGVAARATSPDDVCMLGRSDNPRIRGPKIVVSEASPASFVARGGADGLRPFGAQTECCGRGVTCDRLASATISSPIDFAASATSLYWVTDGQLGRRPLGALTTAPLATDDLQPFTGASALAVEPDDSAAYLVQGTRVVRLRLH